MQRLLNFSQKRDHRYQMEKRNEDVEAPYYVPSTKDILGEHLHCKVQELMKRCFKSSETLSDNQRYQPADKITGMLMERSEPELRMMLEDEHYLLQNVELALKAWRKECTDYISSVSSSEGRKEKRGLSYEELGEVLFEKVSMFEKKWASEITGMLLELDARTLLELLKSDNSVLQKAIEKAKTALLTSKVKSLQKSSESSDSRMGQGVSGQGSSTAGAEGASSKGGGDGSDTDKPMSEEDLREQIGSIIFEIAAKQHPECAAIITGMILELDLPTLQEAIEDHECLNAAIHKAYEVWDANT